MLGPYVGRPNLRCECSRKLQRRVLRQIASPIQHSITQHNITPQQDTPQQDPPQHHTPQQDIHPPQHHTPRQDIHRSKTPHLQTGLLYSYYILNSRKLQRRVLRQIASPIQHSITQHNITPQQDTPQQDPPQHHTPQQDIHPPQHHTPQQDIHRSKTPHLQTGLLYSYYILNYFLAGGRIGAP